jgi:hypothetical protein
VEIKTLLNIFVHLSSTMIAGVDAMRDLMFILGADTRNLRHYAFGAIALGLITYLTALGLAQVVGASTARTNGDAAMAGTTRFYSVTRSVIDPSPTGSIHDLNSVRLDPCKKV